MMESRSAGETPERCDLLLTGGTVITMDDGRRVLDTGAVAVTADRIVAVGTPDELSDYQAVRTIDCHLPRTS